MLSILIPTYNYNCFSLVETLFQQVVLESINFEILVLDDASNDTEIIIQNKKINAIANCHYLVNETNLGRGPSINKLVSLAKYNLFLILDCDTFPKDNYFIKNYLTNREATQSKITFGGIIYDDNKPVKSEMLRWVYGRKREAICVKKRNKDAIKSALTSNILVEKEIMINFPFHGEIKNYGFEDMVFILELKKNNIKVHHIENALYHLKLDTSITYINKFHLALNNLKLLLDNKIIDPKDSTLTKMFYWIDKLKLVGFFSFLFEKSNSFLIKNLTSASPSILVFDLYRLGYFCKINTK